MENNINFKYTYRPYQKKVLDEVEKYLDDGKVHIVAAPGSGKTIVALSLIFKLNTPTLILVPTIAIREQWVERATNDFTNVDLSQISTTLSSMKRYTVVTYQALYEHKAEELKQLLIDNKIKLIVFDEAHHLRNAWFNHITKFISEIPKIKTISLTATPPYDDKKLYNNYINLCGEIDTEVNVPELVANKNLCPHQDYIYFNSVSDEEEKAINEYRTKAISLAISLINEKLFVRAIATHRFFIDFKNNVTDIIENSGAFSTMIKILYKNKIIIPKELKQFAPGINNISIKQVEELFKFVFLDKDPDFKIISKLSSRYKNLFVKIGAIDKNAFHLFYSNSILKSLNENAGKLNSINEIILNEKANLNNKLKMIIVTDFIKNYKEEYDEDAERDCQIGVIPIFNNIREKVGNKVKAIVLTGSIVIIPQELKELFLKICEDENISKDKISMKDYDISFDFFEVRLGSNEKTVKVITKLFKESDVDVLVGTNALIGEGWDAPFVNSLIIASNVSTYISSNQIRGRVIRIDPNYSKKVANIWHLVTVEKDNFSKFKGIEYEKISTRLGHIEGLYLSKAKITNGIQRFEEDIDEIMYSQKSMESLNKYMLSTSSNREKISSNWNTALKEYEKTYNLPISGKVNNKLLGKKMTLSSGSKAATAVGTISVATLATGFSLFVAPQILSLQSFLWLLTMVSFVDVLSIYSLNRSIFREKEAVSYILKTIIKALKKKKLINENAFAKIIKKSNQFFIACGNVDVREQMLIKKCVEETMSNNLETRYMIKTRMIIYNVPSVFDKTKETAEAFYNSYKEVTGNRYAKLIYSKGNAGKLERLRMIQKESEFDDKDTIKLDDYVAEANVLKELFDDKNEINLYD